MNIIEAAKLMKQGCKVRLGHWCENEYLHNHLDMIRDERDEEHELSLCDVLDQGWEIYQEPKLHTFEEALAAYKCGATIYRESIKDVKYTIGTLNPELRIKDIYSEDWVIKKGDQNE